MKRAHRSMKYRQENSRRSGSLLQRLMLFGKGRGRTASVGGREIVLAVKNEKRKKCACAVNGTWVRQADLGMSGGLTSEGSRQLSGSPGETGGRDYY